MDRLEMARKLFENPKLKARGRDGGSYYSVYCSVSDGFKLIEYADDNEILQLIARDNETWEIIELKLKEFCFGEAYYIYQNSHYLNSSDLTSVSGNTYNNISTANLEELKGKWTIEGYYEGE